MTSTFDKFIHDRHDLRKKYFETDGYYKWSDIIDDDNYKRRRDACFKTLKSLLPQGFVSSFR